MIVFKICTFIALKLKRKETITKLKLYTNFKKPWPSTAIDVLKRWNSLQKLRRWFITLPRHGRVFRIYVA